MIYFDNSATTKPHDEVLDSFIEVSNHYYGNVSSVHSLGLNADKLLKTAYEQVGKLLSVQSNEIIFTSGGTEGNNLVIKGIARAYEKYGKHMITTAIEHPSVLHTFQAMESLGFEVSYLPVDKFGVVSVEQVEAALRDDTILVSVMHVNDEFGTIQPIQAIGNLLKDRKNTYFHVDDVQGFGKVMLDINESHVDAATISGHKIHGLKGTGLVYLRENVRLFPLFHGGGEQNNLRSGTTNIAGIVSLVRAMKMILDYQLHHPDHLKQLNRLLRERLGEISELVINTPDNQAPHILNFSIVDLKPEVILRALEARHIYVSKELRQSSLRVSLSYQNTFGEIELFTRALKRIIKEFK